MEIYTHEEKIKTSTICKEMQLLSEIIKRPLCISIKNTAQILKAFRHYEPCISWPQENWNKEFWNSLRCSKLLGVGW